MRLRQTTGTSEISRVTSSHQKSSRSTVRRSQDQVLEIISSSGPHTVHRAALVVLVHCFNHGRDLGNFVPRFDLMPRFDTILKGYN